MEADLLRLGLRLADVGSERLTWRDLLILTIGFRSDSRTLFYLSVNGHSWGQMESLTADLIDTSMLQAWLMANQGSKSPSPRPKPFPRPEALVKASEAAEQKRAAEARARVNPAHVAAWAEQMNGPATTRRQPGETSPAGSAAIPPAPARASPATVAALHQRK